MTFDHARAYLFRLYASSKEGRRDAAGRFGVGFWSVLRFEPESITVRSRPRRGEPWRVELSGDLTRLACGEEGPGPSGTEVELARPASSEESARCAAGVAAAAAEAGRFLTCRGEAGRPLELWVDGRRLDEPFALPPPSVAFRRGRLRGVVGLGPVPRVELYSHGLKVRQAATLEDLLAPAAPGAAHGPAPLGDAAHALAPQVLLDGGLDLLASRDEAREDAVLRRLVALAEAELRRLVGSQLELLRPRPRWRRAADFLGRHLRSPRAAWLAAAAAAVLAAAVFASRPPAPAPGAGVAGGTAGAAVAGHPAERVPAAPAPAVPPAEARPPALFAYRDLAGTYAGPAADEAGAGPQAVALRFSPPAGVLYFAALRLHPARGLAPVAARGVGPFPAWPCAGGCVEVEVIAQGPGPTRLPVPAGHVLAGGGAEAGGRGLRTEATADGEPVVDLGPGSTRLRYLVGRRAADGWRDEGAAAEPALAGAALALRGLPEGERADTAVAWVRSRVAYAATAEVRARHEREAARGRGLVERALTVGKGDCDVMNAVLTLLLSQAGLEARLAVGYVGAAGRALPGLHAWAEHRTAGGWLVADATPGSGGRPADSHLATGDPVLEAASPPVRTADPAGAGPVAPLLGDHRLTAMLLVAAAAGVSLAARARLRTRREVALDPGGRLADVLSAVLQAPSVLEDGVPGLSGRPLVPLLGGGRTSLAAARRAAARGGLYSGHASSALARRVAADGAPVVDIGAEEGAVVAGALAAAPLAWWEETLARARPSPLLRALEAHLRAYGSPCRLCAAPLARGGVEAVDLPAGRVVALDASSPWLEEAEAAFARTPARALFDVAEHLTDALGFPEARAGAQLEPLARRALLEAGA